MWPLSLWFVTRGLFSVWVGGTAGEEEGPEREDVAEGGDWFDSVMIWIGMAERLDRAG